MLKLRLKKSIVCWMTYKLNVKNNIIYLYTIQTNRPFQRKGYGSVILEHFINQYDSSKNIIAKILGGYENTACIKLLSKFHFKPIESNNELYMVRSTNMGQVSVFLATNT